MSRPESPWASDVEMREAWLEAVLDDPQFTAWQRELIRHMHADPTVAVTLARPSNRSTAARAYLEARQRHAARLERRRRVRAAWAVVWRWTGILALVVVCVAVGLSVAP